MNFDFSNKKILITGSSQGIGKAIVNSFLEKKGKVCGISRKKIKFLGDYTHIVENILNPNAVDRIVKKLKKKNFWPIDILIHNAGGTIGLSDPFLGIAGWKKVMRLNFEFIVELDSHLVKPMMKKKFGRIVYISSISGMENHGPVPYCSAKAALTAYARSFGGVLAPSGVVASCLLPGAVIAKNNFWDIKIKTDPKHVAKYLNERQRIGRFGSTKEIADFVIFLSSQYASFNTGSVIPIDGGQGRGYFGQ
jgi:3-oxoacyl-[acyl-carrier protein] reductase